MNVCTKCGAQNPDGSTFCSVCGAPLTPNSQQKPAAGGASAAVKGGKNNNLIMLVGIAVIAIAVVALLIALIAGGGGYKKVATKYVQAVFEMDAGDIVKLMPLNVDDMDDFYADFYYVSKSKVEKELTKEFEDAWDRYEDDLEDVKSLKTKVTDVDDMKSKNIKTLNGQLDDMGYDVEIKEGKTIEVTISGKYGKDKFEFDVDIDVYKIGGKWYILYPDFSLLSQFLKEIS